VNEPWMIPPEGNPETARYILVGEAPGEKERLMKRPFVGPAGNLLNSLLHSAGILRSDCLIVNVVREYPEGGIGKFISFAKPKTDLNRYALQDGVWVTDEYLLYEELLRRTVREAKARIVVPLGGVALFALTRQLGITKRRGSIYISEEKKIIPTIHPAAALRMYTYTYLILNDLQKAKEEVAQPDLGLPSRTLTTEPSFAECIGWFALHQTKKRVAFDIETIRTKVDGKFTDWEVSCFSLASSGNYAQCIPLVRANHTDYFNPEQEAEIWKNLAKILQDSEIEILGQNLLFDAAFLFKKHGIRITNIADTMVAQSIIAPDLPKGLDFLCSVYTREPYYKDEGKQYHKITNEESFWIYSAKDSAVLFEIYEKQLARLEAQGNLEAYRARIRTLEPLLFIQARGILCDTEGTKSLSIECKEKANALEVALQDMCGFKINPRSPAQLKEYFYIRKGLYAHRKKGAITTDEKALLSIAAKGHQEARLVLDIRKLEKLRSTYLDMTLDPDDRIRSSMKPYTKTGRLSSGQTIFGTGGNIQNDPPEFKQFMVADPGYVLYDIDLSQAENRIVANIAPEQKMLEAFEQGLDVHSLTGSLIFGDPVEQIIEENAAGVPAEIGQGIKTKRFWGKTANHALNYGLGPNTFAIRAEITVAEATWIHRQYHSAYPGIAQYHAWIRAALQEDRTLVNCFGLRRKFLGRWENSLFQEAYAQIPQSTVAYAINERAMVPIYEKQRDFWGCELLNQVHDSIVFQIQVSKPWSYHARCLFLLKKNLERPILWRGREFVIPAEIKMGKNMKDMIEVGIHWENLERAYKELTEKEEGK